MRSLCSRSKNLSVLFVLALLPGLASEAAAQTGLPYDIVYVRQPRYGDEINTPWPEAPRDPDGRPEPT